MKPITKNNLKFSGTIAANTTLDAGEFLNVGKTMKGIFSWAGLGLNIYSTWVIMRMKIGKLTRL